MFKESKLNFSEDDRPWNYPGIGYHSTQGSFIINDEQHDGPLTIVPIAMRQSWLVESLEGRLRLNMYTPKAQLPEGDAKPHLQVLMYLPEHAHVNGGFYIMGIKSWTGIKAFTNPETGRYRDEGLSTGLWVELSTGEFSKEVAKAAKRRIPPHFFKFQMSSSKKALKVGPKGSIQVYPLVFTPDLSTDNLEELYVGDDMVELIEDWCDSENIKGWVSEWASLGKTAEAAAIEETFADEPSKGIPF